MAILGYIFVIFWFMGLGRFLSFVSDIQMSSQTLWNLKTVNWPQKTGVWSLPDWEGGDHH